MNTATQQHIQQNEKIPMSQKIVFGIGMLANQLFPAALGIFMVILVQSLGMSPLLWSLIFFIPKLIAGYSGSWVDVIGYSNFFIVTALLGLPVLILIIWLSKVAPIK